MHRASDERLLAKAREADRILVTRDKDFGALSFLKESLSAGVILLRLTPMTVEMVHRELGLMLNEQAEDELKSLFCVVEQRGWRSK